MASQLDTFIKLIQQLRINAIEDDEDPNNIVLQTYTSPFDRVTISDSVRARSSSSLVWGNGSTYTAYDSNGNPYQATSCGWYWCIGGRWGGLRNFIFPWQSY